MLLIKIDQNSRQPIYRQILEEIRGRIERRSIQPGDRLPSTRQLADLLGVHRSTVALAYQELWALGFIDLRPGARPRARSRMRLPGTGDDGNEGLLHWPTAASKASTAVMRAYERIQPITSRDKKAIIGFKTLDMDHRLFPVEHFRSCLSRVTKKKGLSLLGYGDHAGFPPLREYIAHRLQTHGISVTPGEILITNGSQQGIDMVLRMLAAPGRAVAIESPTYGHILPLLHLAGLKPLEIPVRHDGMDLTALSRRMRDRHPVLVYTMPTFQNPTGVTTNQPHRERLLSICEQHRAVILEDGFDEEMKYYGKVVLPIKSMDTRRIVIYCGTFSKVLFPGVRIGWIAAQKECIERLAAIRCFVDLSSNMILQAAMHEFCSDGYYDRHISKMHRVFRRRMEAATRALRERVSPEWAEWADPTGGYLIWLKLKPVSKPPSDWESWFAAHGVEVAHGRRFFLSDPPDAYVRLSISARDEEEIIEGVNRFAGALRGLHARGPE